MSSTAVRTPDDVIIGFDGRFLQDKFSGIGRYAFGLLKGLSTLNGSHRVLVFVNDSLPNSRFPLSELKGLDHVELVGIRTPLRSVGRESISWWRKAQHSRFNVFHTPEFWSPLAMPCPIISTVHDMIPEISRDYLSSRSFGVGYKIASRSMMRQASAVIAISESTRQDIYHYVGRKVGDKASVVLNGIEPRFQPVTDTSALALVRRKYKLPERFFLAVGIRRAHKNIERLVEAFANMADQIPHGLVLVGAADPRFRDNVEPHIQRLGDLKSRIVELSFVPDEDLIAVYSMADLFVHPSLAEGFGFPVLEAMACGCPVACSNTTSLPEVVGSAALLFDPKSVTDITQKVRSALESPVLRADLQARGMAHAATFSWERAAKSTLGLYRAVAFGTHQ